ncbi:MAG: hypothetical protein CMH56_15160 [Myxococcales bacterium]|nr:hypothetical protein [Myxococcales bacterium]
MFFRTNFLMMLTSVAFLALTTGCPEDPTGGDGDGDATLPIGGGGNGNQEGSRSLAFQGASPVTLFFGDHVDLAFVLKDKDGTPVAGDSVNYSLDGSYATLGATSATTSTQGISTVRLTAGSARGNLLLTASAEGATDAVVTINVKEATDGSLLVNVTSQTRITVTDAYVRVYRGANGAVTHTCASLAAAANMPNPTYTADIGAMPGNHEFETISHNSNLTVYVEGKNETGMVVGTGCQDQLTMQGGEQNVVDIVLTQDASDLADEYDVLLRVQMDQGLPEPYQTYVSTTAAVLGDPVGYGTWYALKGLHKRLMEGPCFGLGDLVDSSGAVYETGAGVPYCYALGFIDLAIANANDPAICDDYTSRENECAEARAACFADSTNEEACNDTYCNDPDGILGNGDEACSCYASFECVSEGGYTLQPLVANTLDQAAANNEDIGETYSTIKSTGVDLELLATDFEVGARFDVQDVDSEGNALPEGTLHVDETWREYVFNWSLGCDESDDLGCRRRSVTIPTDENDPLYRAGMTTEYNASYSQASLVNTDGTSFDERFRINPDAHAITLHYGSILLLAMEQVVFPSICEGCTSLQDVLNSFIGCTNPDGTPGPGAIAIADGINGLINLLDYNPAATLCSAGLGFAAGYAEGQVTELQVAPSETADVKDIEGLAGTGVFYLVDEDMDLKTEYVRDVGMELRWNDPADPLGSADLAAPISGHGRAAAEDCVNDSECAAVGTVCAPIPHYLEIAKVELACIDALQSTTSTPVVGGGQSCTADEQCQTGICIDLDADNTSNVIADGICYMACDTTATEGQCSNGQVCEADAVDILIDGQSKANGAIFGSDPEDVTRYNGTDPYYGSAPAPSCMPEETE